MKYVLVLLSLYSFVFGFTKSDVYKAYKQKDFKRACYISTKIYLNYRDDDDFLTLFANSCLQDDNINRMAFPAMLLLRSPEARSNSIYFLTILYQKKLLYKAMIDGFDVSQFKFPTTNYILSKIFVKYSQKKYKKIANTLIFDDDNDKHIKYKLNVIKDKGVYKMILGTYKDGVLIKKRAYW